MSFRHSKSLKHIILPISGHLLGNIVTEPGVALLFRAPSGLESQLELYHEVVLIAPDGSKTIIAATKPGATWDPIVAYEAFRPLLHKAVTAAVAHSNGRLEVTFEDGIAIQVHPDNYEAWHFQQPAPRSKTPYPKDYISVYGYEGGLI